MIMTSIVIIYIDYIVITILIIERMSKNKPLLGYDLRNSHYLVGQIHCKQVMAIVYHFNGVCLVRGFDETILGSNMFEVGYRKMKSFRASSFSS